MDYIKGRDESLDTILIALKQGLVKRSIKVVEKNLTSPGHDIWWVQIVHEASGLFTNGKGTSELGALVSGYAEFYERLFSGFFFESSYIDFSEGDFILHKNEQRVSASDKWYGQSIDEPVWNHPHGAGLPFVNQDGNEHIIPYQVLTRLTCSNGIAVGSNYNEAFVQGMSEIFERFVRREIFNNGYSLPDIPDSLVEKVLGTEFNIELKKSGYKLICKDASLGGKYPVISAALVKNGACVISFGAHPQWDVALSRTVTEMFQGRRSLADNDFVYPSSDLDEVRESANLESHFVNSTGEIHLGFFSNKSNFKLALWECPDNRSDELLFLKQCLGKLELFEWTRKIDDIYLVRLVVPGISEVYPLEELDASHDHFKAKVFGLVENVLSQTACDHDILDEIHGMGGNAFFEVEEFLGISFAGYPLVEGLSLAELCVFGFLMNDEFEKAKDMLEYLVIPMTNDKYRLGLYNILINYEILEDSMTNLYSEKMLLVAKDLYSSKLPAEIPASINDLPKVQGVRELYVSYCKEG